MTKGVKGSLTVEAAFAFPVFLFAIMAMLYIFRFIGAEYEMERGIFEASRRISASPGLAQAAYELFPGLDGFVGEITDEIVIGAAVRDEVDESVFSLIKNGTGGLSFWGSRVFEDDVVTIKCSYELVLPFSFFGLDLSIPVVHDHTYRYFNGHDIPTVLREKEEEEPQDESESEKVYVTQSGSVYHVSTGCPALKISKRQIMSASLSTARNASGGKYKPCEKCASGQMPAVCYITDSGDRFHYKSDCSALKRSFREITKDEAVSEGYRECKRCQSSKKG